MYTLLILWTFSIGLATMSSWVVMKLDYVNFTKKLLNTSHDCRAPEQDARERDRQSEGPWNNQP